MPDDTSRLSALTILLACSLALLLGAGAQAAPTCSLPLTPTNATTGFTQIPLTPVSGGSGFLAGVGHPEWPSQLATETLVWPLANGDSILIASRPYATSHGGGVGIEPSSTAIWKLASRIYANNLGIISTGGLVFNGTGGAADAGKTLLTVTASYVDGRSFTTDLKVGEHMRNWVQGSLVCVNGQFPYYATQPTSPLVRQLFAGLGSDGTTTVFYDLQQIPFPDTLRNVRIDTIAVQGGNIDHSPDGCPSSTSEINGLALWPSFEIRNRQGGGLGLQTQFDSTWQGKSYGGYVLRDTLFGAFKKIKALGCMLSCMAMVASYFGDSAQVDQLNDYLARHGGYDREGIVRVRSLTGQDPGATIAFQELGDTALLATKTAVGDTLLFEARNANAGTAPLLTARVTSISNVGHHGQATIIQRHQRGVLSVDEEGYAYDSVIVPVVSDGWSQGHWKRTGLGAVLAVTSMKAESTLVDSSPVLLQECGHFVLARGWTPTVGTNSAHGTYLVNDPGHLNVFRLTDSRYNNSFAAARAFRRTDPGGPFAPAAASGGMAVAIAGAHASVVGPGGNTFYFDASKNAYVGDLPNADGWPGYTSTLDTEPDAGNPASDYIELPEAQSGDYQVIVFAPNAGSYAITARANGASVSPQAVGGFTTAGPSGYAFNVHLVSGGTTTIRVDTLGKVAVPPGNPVWDVVSGRPNPSRGIVEIAFRLSTDCRASVDVFDIAGRKLRRVFGGVAHAGSHAVTWDGRNEDGVAVPPGLYFVRANLPQGSITKRIVVTD